MGSWREHAWSQRLHRRQESLLPGPCAMPGGAVLHYYCSYAQVLADDAMCGIGTDAGHFALDCPHEGPG